MDKFAKAVVGWAVAIAIGNMTDRAEPRPEGEWPTPKRLALVAGAAMLLNVVMAFVEKAFTKQTTKPEKIRVSI